VPPSPTLKATVAPTKAPAAPTVAPTPPPATATAGPNNAAAVAKPSASPSASPATATATALASTTSSTSTSKGGIHGVVFVDDNADGTKTDGEPGVAQFAVTLAGSNGSRTVHTDVDGKFAFDGMVPGVYHLSIDVPDDQVPTSDAGLDV